MATSEAAFKRDFKKGIRENYGVTVCMRSHADWGTVGFSDLSILHQGKFCPLEAKFVKKVPKRETSLLLSHELTPAQADYLSEADACGGFPGVLIGFSDCFVAVPFHLWPRKDGRIHGNITLQYLKFVAKFHHLEFSTKQLSGFLEHFRSIPRGDVL